MIIKYNVMKGKFTSNLKSKITAVFLISILLFAFHLNYASVTNFLGIYVTNEFNEEKKGSADALEDILLNGVPNDTIVDCDSDVINPASFTIAGTTIPSCGLVSIDFEREVIDSMCLNKKTIYHIWTATDECLNICRDTQIVIVDNIRLISLVQSGLMDTFVCSSDFLAIYNANIRLDGQCGIVEQNYVLNFITRGCVNKRDYSFSWRVVDECNNVYSGAQMVYIRDTLSPVIQNVPEDVTVSCQDEVPEPFNMVTASDNCGVNSQSPLALVVNRFVQDSICPENKIILYIWTATDACTNVVRDTQKITVFNTLPPIIRNVPPDVTFECSSDEPDVDLSIFAEGTCGEVDVVFQREVFDSTCINGKKIRNIWIASSDCGIETRDTQIITINDSVSPSISFCPRDTVLNCPGDTSVANLGIALGADNCMGEVIVNHVDMVTQGSCPNVFSVVRTWIVTDICGNSTSCIQNIAVQDTTSPLINTGEIDTILLFCEMEVPPPFDDINDLLEEGIEIVESCCLDSMSLQLVSEEVIEENNLTYTIRTYSLSDCCENIGIYTAVYISYSECAVDLAIKKEIVGQRPYVVDDPMAINFRVTVYNQLGVPTDSIKLVDYMPSRGSEITTQGWQNLGNGQSCITLSIENGLLPTGGLETGDSVVLYYTMSIDIEAMRPITYNFIEISDMKGLEGQDIEDIDSTPDDIFGNDNQITSLPEEDPRFAEDDISGVVFFNCGSLECNALVNVSLDENCEAIIDPSYLNGNYKDLPFGLELYDKNGKLIPNNKLTSEHIGQKIKASVINIAACRANSCWGYIYVEDKFPPILMTPPDTTVYCVAGLTPDKTGEATAEDCSEVKVTYRDVLVIKKDKCEREGDTLRVICREWSAMDVHGMVTLDTQKITVLNIPDSLIRVPTQSILLSCGASTHPDSLMKYLSTKDAYPHYKNPTTGEYVKIGLGESCNLLASYIDGPKLYSCGEYCGGSYKMIRTWTILNWCTVKSRTFHQIIKVEDKEAPVVEVVEPTTVFNTNAWKCSMDLDLPEGVAIDECDPSPRIVQVEGPIGVRVVKEGRRWRAYDVPKGETVFRYTAQDCCGNIGDTEITIRVEDRVAPVPVAKEFITVSLTSNNDSVITGVAKLKVENIDNGSYDNCSPIYMEIRREIDSPACLNIGTNGYNNNVTYNNRLNALDQETGLHANDDLRDTDLGKEVKFCCEDIGKEVKVYLRVWDDGDMDGVFGSAGDNYNETWTMVKVEDKSEPKLNCKPTIITNCKSDSGRVFVGLGWLEVEGRVPVGLWPQVSSVCAIGLKLEFRDEGSLTSCNTTLPQQVIRRTYRVKGTNANCLQEIVIEDIKRNAELDYPIEVMKWNKCTLTEEDVLTNTWRATKASAKPERGFGTEVWRNSAGEPLIFRPDYRDTGCAIYGRRIKIEEYETNEGCKKWVVRFDYINWCDVEETSFREVTYKYEDTIAPQITKIKERDTIEVDPVSCEAMWSIKLEGIDPDNECDGGLTWRVRLTKGSIIREEIGRGPQASVVFKNLESGMYKINYRLTDACGNVSIKDGELLVKGKKPTPYCINLSSAVMKNGTVELWAKDFDKGSFGNCANNVIYFTFDEAHPVLNKLNRTHYFRGKGIEVNGADTTEQYLSGTVQKWVPEISIRQRPNLSNGSPDPRGPDTTVISGSSARLFGCKVGDGSTFPSAEVKMTVWDEDLNSDFCTVELFLIDNVGDCSGHSLVSIGGSVNTMYQEPMINVEVELGANLPEFPVKASTNVNGEYEFKDLPIGARYEIKPRKTNDYLNGVNTLDLVQIQRHILGIKRLDDPYLMIAADADGDESIRINDIIEIRKLILGISEKLPKVDSWRMLKKVPEMGKNPWPFEEVILHGILTEDQRESDFIGVKVGDVDGSASTNIKSISTEPRSVGVKLSIENKMIKAGDEVDVIVKSAEFNEVHGMQFTLKHPGLELLSIEGRGIELSREQTGNPQEGLTTLSWAAIKGVTIEEGNEVMRLRFKSQYDISTEKALEITNEVTMAEAYVGFEMERVSISLETRNTDKVEVFSLSQNEPNPWKDHTTIKFELPESNNVMLRIIDVTGKEVLKKDIKAVKGENIVQLSRSEINNLTGIFHYLIEVGKQTITKKMFVIE
jgi:hypothetical protein